MQLTVLVDNNTLIDRYFLAEPGLSFLVEADGMRVLFDTGFDSTPSRGRRDQWLRL